MAFPAAVMPLIYVSFPQQFMCIFKADFALYNAACDRQDFAFAGRST
jgi:hypothetical protein